METRDVIRKVLPAIAGVVGFGPLIAEGIKRWADRNGYLDDPSKGLQWVLTTVASLTEWWLFYPVLCFFVGLTFGLWLDRLMRRRSKKRSTELRSVGHEMLSLAHFIEREANRSLNAWPVWFGGQISRTASVFIKANSLGIWTPTNDAFELDDGGFFLHRYFDFVGRLLADGHFNEAKQQSVAMSVQFHERLAFVGGKPVNGIAPRARTSGE